MCGYFGNLHECPEVLALLAELGLDIKPLLGRSYNRQTIQGLITFEDGHYQISECLWWYQLKAENGRFSINDKVTSFNARDLQKPLWRNAIKSRRGIFFATEIGESNGKNRYLMRSKKGLVLGALYKDWQAQDTQPARSVAIITRPPHPRFSKYHTQSIPCFLPMNIAVIKEWLNPDIAESPLINYYLDNPKIYAALDVQKVKTYKHAEPIGQEELLEADEL